MEWHEWVRTLGSGGTLVAVLVAIYQLYLNRQQSKANFEDDLSREYRDISGAMPSDAFFHDADKRAPMTPAQLQAMFRYFDLSNEQLRFGRQRRVTRKTRRAWQQGIEQNLALPRFERAWIDVTSWLPEDHFTHLYAIKAAAPRGSASRHSPNGRRGARLRRRYGLSADRGRS